MTHEHDWAPVHQKVGWPTWEGYTRTDVYVYRCRICGEIGYPVYERKAA